MAERHGFSAPIVPLNFFPGPAPRRAGYEVGSISEVLKSSRKNLSHLVIGGGDLLRTDADSFATHYYSTFKNGARFDWWWRLKEKTLGRKRLKQQFIRKYMGYSPLAPFILDAANHSSLDSVMYCSCGVPFPIPARQSPAIQRAFESAALIYVRDFPSRDKLRQIGVSRPIEVAPDLIVTLSDFYAPEEERRKGIALLAGAGVDPTKEIICVQSNPQRPEPENELFSHLIALKGSTGAEIVLMPIGFCHEDDQFSQRLVAKSKGVLTYLAVPSIHDMVSVIAGSNLFIGTSLHGNITAFSFGIPHFFGPLAVDKIGGFLEIAGLGNDFQMKSWSQLASKRAMVRNLPEDFFARKAETAKQAVHETFGKIVELLKTSGNDSIERQYRRMS
jgi:polysaccharide pyruvyl transferase WcaK-like protein